MRHVVKQHKIEFVILILLIIIGAFLRLWQFEEFTRFLGDQGRDAIILKNIITFQDLPTEGAQSSIGTIRLGPFYYYLMAPFLLLSFFHPIGIAYGICFLSILGIIISYLIIRKEYNAYVAFVFTFFSIFAVQLIDAARFGWNPNLVPIASFLTLYAGYKYSRSGNKYDVIVFGLLYSVATQLHHLAFLLGLPFAGIIIYRLVTRKDKLTMMKHVGMMIGSFLLLYLPFLLHEVKTSFANVDAFKRLFTDQHIVSSNDSVVEKLLQTNQYFLTFIVNVPLHTFIALGIMVGIIGAIIYLVRKNKNDFLITIHTSYLVIYLAIFSFIQSNAFPHYFASIYLSFYLIIAYLLDTIRSKLTKYILTAIVLIAFLMINIPHYYFFYEKPPHDIALAKAVAMSFRGKSITGPVNIAALPTYERYEQYHYFLEQEGFEVTPFSFFLPPQDVYVICVKSHCDAVNDPVWPKEFNKRTELEHWKVEGIEKDITIHHLRVTRSELP